MCLPSRWSHGEGRRPNGKWATQAPYGSTGRCSDLHAFHSAMNWTSRCSLSEATKVSREERSPFPMFVPMLGCPMSISAPFLRSHTVAVSELLTPAAPPNPASNRHQPVFSHQLTLLPLRDLIADFRH